MGKAGSLDRKLYYKKQSDNQIKGPLGTSRVMCGGIVAVAISQTTQITILGLITYYPHRGESSTLGWPVLKRHLLLTKILFYS